MQPAAFFTNKKAIVILALFACVLWGSAFPAVKFGYALFSIGSDIPAQLLFAGYRFFLAGILVIILGLATGKTVVRFSGPNWFGLGVMGLLTFAQYIFFYLGLANTTGVKGSILNSTGTFFTVLLAHFAHKNDRLNKYTVTGCLLGFLGVFIVNRGSGSLDWQFALNGEGFLVVASFAGAAASVYGKGLSQRVDPTMMTGWQLLIGGGILILLGLALGGLLSIDTPAGVALMVYMAFISSTAFALYAVLMKYNPVSKIVIFSFTIPLFGALQSAFFLGESLFEWKNLFALALVCSGVWLVTARAVKGIPAANQPGAPAGRGE